MTKFFSLQRFYYSWFVQDNWRVNSEAVHQHGPAQRFDHRMEGDDTTAWPASFPDSGGTLVPVGTAPFTGDSVHEGRPWQLGPRFGLRLHITPKTVIRAGGGIFYSFKTVTSGNSLAKNAPFSGTLVTTNDANNFAAAKPISAGFPAERPELWPIPGTGFYYWPEDARPPRCTSGTSMCSGNSVANMVLSVAYVGGKGTYVDVVGLEYQPGGSRARSGGDPAPLPEPQRCHRSGSVGQLDPITPCRRPSIGGWGRCASPAPGHGRTASTTLAASQATARFRTRAIWPRSGRVPLSMCVTSWRSAERIELPFGKGRHWMSPGRAPVHWVVGGWQINNIVTFQSGLAVYADDADEHSEYRDGLAVPEPDRVRRVLPSGERTIDRWFDASAFVAPAQLHFGNSGRNILYGPGTKQIDLSLFKSFPVCGEPPARISGRGIQRIQYAAVQQSERQHRIHRGGADHQRRQPDGVSADFTTDPAGAEALFLMLFAPPPPPPVSFSHEVAPIMAMHCNICHGDAGGLSTRSYVEIMAGGNLGRVIVPGDPDKSLLIHFLDGRRGENRRMPKDEAPLSITQIETIRRWIAEGAKNDDISAPTYRIKRTDVRMEHVDPDATLGPSRYRGICRGDYARSCKRSAVVV